MATKYNGKCFSDGCRRDAKHVTPGSGDVKIFCSPCLNAYERGVRARKLMVEALDIARDEMITSIDELRRQRYHSEADRIQAKLDTIIKTIAKAKGGA